MSIHTFVPSSSIIRHGKDSAKHKIRPLQDDVSVHSYEISSGDACVQKRTR